METFRQQTDDHYWMRQWMLSQFAAKGSIFQNVSYRRRAFTKEGESHAHWIVNSRIVGRINIVADEFCGESSLLRSREETGYVVPLSATSIVGASQTNDANVHEIADNLLQSTSSASPVLHTTLHRTKQFYPVQINRTLCFSCAHLQFSLASRILIIKNSTTSIFSHSAVVVSEKKEKPAFPV